MSAELLEAGPLRAALKLCRTYRDSTITQTIRLSAGSRRLDFHTGVDWHEQHILLRVAFPLNVLNTVATYDIQWGEIQHPTHGNTKWDYARFEVPGQKWADISEGGFGVALLNDCKHGYSAQDNVLKLSLIKSSTSPDLHADQGHHEFTYALLSHAGNLSEVRLKARRLNDPVVVLPGKQAIEAPPW